MSPYTANEAPAQHFLKEVFKVLFVLFYFILILAAPVACEVSWARDRTYATSSHPSRWMDHAGSLTHYTSRGLLKVPFRRAGR